MRIAQRQTHFGTRRRSTSPAGRRKPCRRVLQLRTVSTSGPNEESFFFVPSAKMLSLLRLFLA